MYLSNQLRNLSQRIKISSAEHLITSLLNLLPTASDEILIQAAYLLDRLAKTEQKKEAPPPFVVLISPTMRYNLGSRGCYAANYTNGFSAGREVIAKSQISWYNIPS